MLPGRPARAGALRPLDGKEALVLPGRAQGPLPPGRRGAGRAGADLDRGRHPGRRRLPARRRAAEPGGEGIRGRERGRGLCAGARPAHHAGPRARLSCLWHASGGTPVRADAAPCRLSRAPARARGLRLLPGPLAAPVEPCAQARDPAVERRALCRDRALCPHHGRAGAEVRHGPGRGRALARPGLHGQRPLPRGPVRIRHGALRAPCGRQRRAGLLRHGPLHRHIRALRRARGHRDPRPVQHLEEGQL